MEEQGSNQSSSEPRKGGRKRNIAIVAIIVVIALIASAFVYDQYSDHDVDDTGSVGQITDHNMTTVSIPLASISETATWYEYNVSGATVRFFAVLDGNGTVHVAADECPLCYGAHLGFHQEGTSMVENCCNMPFPIDQITATGCTDDDCCPIFLPSIIDGDLVIIKKSALASQRFIFLEKDESAHVSAYNETSISIPLAFVSEIATWYQYEVNGTSVRFFAVMDENGDIHTSMDICPKCYKKHAGFRQQDGINMVENCCNMAFRIENITAEGCAIPVCHPAFVANEIIGDNVVIAISDLEAGSYMFV